MPDARDMDAPLTRREMYEAFDLWGGALSAQIAQLGAQLAQLSAQFAQMGAQLAQVPAQMKVLIEDSEARVMTEMRLQNRGSEDELATRLVAVDDQYKDLPKRVRKLEAKVFPPKRGAATARRRR